jgi:hypothetical protein
VIFDYEESHKKALYLRRELRKVRDRFAMKREELELEVQQEIHAAAARKREKLRGEEQEKQETGEEKEEEGRQGGSEEDEEQDGGEEDDDPLAHFDPLVDDDPALSVAEDRWALAKKLEEAAETLIGSSDTKIQFLYCEISKIVKIAISLSKRYRRAAQQEGGDREEKPEVEANDEEQAEEEEEEEEEEKELKLDALPLSDSEDEAGCDDAV